MTRQDRKHLFIAGGTSPQRSANALIFAVEQRELEACFTRLVALDAKSELQAVIVGRSGAPVNASIAVIKSRGVPTALKDENLDGGTRNLTQTVRAYARQGLKVSIFSSSPELSEPQIELVDDIAIHRLPVHVDARHTGVELDVLRAEKLATGLLSYSPFADATFDYLHTHHWTSAVPAIVQRRNYRRRYVHTPHLLIAEKLNFLGLPAYPNAIDIERAALACADKVIAVSHAEADTIRSLYGTDPQRIAIIPNGVSAEFSTSSLNAATLAKRMVATPLRLVSVGRLAHQKGVDILVRAVALSAARGLDVRCTVIGGEYHSEPGLMAALTGLAATLGVADRIDFTGYLPTAAIVKVLASSAIYIQPSRYESQGLATLEAMASGLPVIATRLPAVTEYLTEGVNGRLIDSESPEAAADALSYLMAHKDQAVAMGSVNRNVASRMDWESACALTMAALVCEAG